MHLNIGQAGPKFLNLAKTFGPKHAISETPGDRTKRKFRITRVIMCKSTILWKFYNFSKIFTKICQNFEKICQNFTKFAKILRNFPKFYEISKNFTKICLFSNKSFNLGKKPEIEQNGQKFGITRVIICNSTILWKIYLVKLRMSSYS